MARVRLQKLRKLFGDDTVAVHDLDLDVRDEEFLTLLGPSGCGKTTTLRMIAGLESPTSGEIYFNDTVVNDMSPAKRNIAMVFQSYALYPHMTVRGNLEYPLAKRRIPAAQRGAMIAQTAELLQIQDLLNRRPRQLSGGQQQRVALGRAIIRDPQVFLLDEPLSNLDAKLRAHMRVELIQLHRRIGKTMIYVTHDQLEAMTMSDRIAIMNEGSLQQLATPDDIYNHPVNRFVAGFIGTPAMNFLEGAIEGNGSGRRFTAGPLIIRIPDDVRLRQPGGGTAGQAVAGVRPEDILIGGGAISADVMVVEPTGHETLVFLDAFGHKLVARVDANTKVKALTQVQIGFRESKVHLFDQNGGMNLRD